MEIHKVGLPVAWLLGLLVAGSALAQSTHPRPFQRAAEDYFALLMTRSYDALERATEEGRKGALLSDGQPKLAALYAATAGDSSIRLTDEMWQARRQRLQEWRTRFPNSVAAKVALASFPIAYGMFARGTGYGNTVSDEAFKLMRERMEESRVALEALDPASKADPGWPASMLDIAVAQHWPRERIDELYKVAAEQHPYFLPIHFQWVRYYAPRWHGSPDDQRRAIDSVVERTRERMGETMYARLNWAMATNDMFQTRLADWPRMKAGFERMTKDYPDPWNVNAFARFACTASDWATMSGLAGTIGDGVVSQAWPGGADHYRQCRDYARKMTSK